MHLLGYIALLEQCFVQAALEKQFIRNDFVHRKENIFQDFEPLRSAQNLLFLKDRIVISVQFFFKLISPCFMCRNYFVCTGFQKDSSGAPYIEIMP